MKPASSAPRHDSPYGTFAQQEEMAQPTDEADEVDEAKQIAAPMILNAESKDIVEGLYDGRGGGSKVIVLEFHARNAIVPVSHFDATYPIALRDFVPSPEYLVLINAVNTIAKGISTCFRSKDDDCCIWLCSPLYMFAQEEGQPLIYDVDTALFLEKRQAISDYLLFCSAKFRDRGVRFVLVSANCKGFEYGKASQRFYEHPFWIEIHLSGHFLDMMAAMDENHGMASFAYPLSGRVGLN